MQRNVCLSLTVLRDVQAAAALLDECGPVLCLQVPLLDDSANVLRDVVLLLW